MLTLLTLLIMLVVAYAYFREGLLTAITMCLNVFLAGLIAFNFWEPLADSFEEMFPSFLLGYEDALSLMLPFVISLLLLRWVTNSMVPTLLNYHPALQRGGAAFFGLVTGYLVSGFFICMLQTLPWHENFMGYELRPRAGSGLLAQLFPPDHLWLASMRKAGAYCFANRADPAARADASAEDQYWTFDRYASFPYRYAKYRRYGGSRELYFYQGELEKELYRRPVPAAKR